MRTSQRGIAFIKDFEKFRPYAYRNSKNEPWTIGWGNTMYANGKPVRPGDTITREAADKLFEFWLGAFERDVQSLLKTQVTQGQFDALVSFAYNCGSDIDEDTKAEGLGDSTLLKYVNEDPNDERIPGEFMKWISRGTVFEKGLKRRRQGEVELYKS